MKKQDNKLQKIILEGGRVKSTGGDLICRDII